MRRNVLATLVEAATARGGTTASAESLDFNGSAYGRAVDDLFGGAYQSVWTMEAWVKTSNPVQDRGAILNKDIYGAQWSADSPTVVPEPRCVSLVCLGLVGLALLAPGGVAALGLLHAGDGVVFSHELHQRD